MFFNKRAINELRANPAWIGAKLWDAIPETLGTPFEINYRAAMASRVPYVFEEYFQPLSAWYQVHAIPVDDGLTVIFRNINEHRSAAEALRERERQLATVFGQTVVGILHRDLDYRVLMVNRRYCEIVGRNREELDGLPMRSFTHDEDIAWNVQVYQENLKTGEPFQIEKRYVRPDGTSVWCAVNVSFVRDDTGQIVSTITVAEDINDRKLTEGKLRESRDLLQVVIDSIQDLIFVKDREGRFVFTNRELTEGCGPLQGLTSQDRFSRDLSEAYLETDKQVLTSGEPCVVEDSIPIHGELRRFQTIKVPWRQDGEIIGVIGVSRDLTERLQAESELVESRRQLATLIDNLPGLVYKCTIEAPWRFFLISEGAEALTGYTATEFMDQKITWGDLTYPEDIANIEEMIARSIEQRSIFNIEYRITTRSGETRWVIDRGQCIYDADGRPAFLEGIVSDITAQKEAEEGILWAALHDPLTRLPNRTLFQKRLEEALNKSALSGRKVGLLILDVDHLKEINDTSGHDAGDAALIEVADRLRASVRAIDTVARNGGDEFAVILPDIADQEEMDTTIKLILERLQRPLIYANRSLDCSASIGASIWPDHADEAADLLKQADVALYMAKATGRRKVMVFEPSMRIEVSQKTQMRSRAREAIDTHRIEPFYQPKVHLTSGELAGFEALLRWRNAEKGIEAPSTIQAAFDDPHLSIALGRRMQDMVFKDMRRWLDAGIDFGHVAINASAAEFRSKEFEDQILESLRTNGIPAHYLELEVTETVFLGRGAEGVEKALRTLSAEGVKIALDDFGTGYASLSHLKQFPVDIIKIDRSFVHDLAHNPDDTVILQAVLNLARNLSITTVAEGVETVVQADFLRNQGCDIGQGYLFGKAGPSIQLPELVRSWNAATFAKPKEAS